MSGREMDIKMEKKRRTFSGGNIRLKTSKASEKDRLRYILSNVSPDIIVDRLRSALESDNVQTRTTLAMIFDKSTFPLPSKARCTRCCKDFDPNYNTNTSCKIPHDDIDRIHKHSRGSTWKCYKCHETWESSYYDVCDDVDFGYCFEGAHTVEEIDSEEEESPAKRRRY